MPYTLEQYTTLQNAIAQGASEVFYGDKKVKYRSLNDMQTLLDQMENELFPPTDTVAGQNKNRRVAAFYKGL